MSPSVILYVITDLEIGGVPLHLYRLARAMRERGIEPHVVSLAEPGPIGERLRSEGFNVSACGGRGGWDLRVVFRLARIIDETGPDIVHALLFHANLAARLAARWTGFSRDRVLCEIQTVEVERRWHLIVDRWTHRGCRLTIGNSPSVLDHLAAHAGIPRDRLRLVRGGIDPAPLRDAVPIDRTTLGVPADAPLVLWVGRLDPVKGLVELIQAFESVVSGTDAHLVLVGDGPLRSELVRRINSSDIADRVHLVGARDDVPRLLKTADVFVLPSRTEGLPNALLEAMAAGCPIVTTDVPGCRDLVANETTGRVVPFGDTAALAEAIRLLLQDRAAAVRWGDRAQEEVSRRWHFSQTIEAYHTLYQSVLQGAGRH